MTGRPRQFDRDQALQVALNAFWRDGYEATSIAGLTAAIGINPPSLYAAFGDKACLFQEAADNYTRRFRSGVRDALDQPTAHQAMVELLRVTADAHTDPHTPPGCLILSEPRLATERSWMHDTIAGRVVQGQDDGDVDSNASPQSIAEFIDIVMAGMSARARDGADPATLLGAAALAADALEVVMGHQPNASRRR